MNKLLYVLFVAVYFASATQAQTHVSSQVSASEDDAEEDLSDGSMDITSSDLEMCLEDNIWPIPNDDQTLGIRFQNLSIPNGAIIDSAHIQFTSDETTNDPTVVIIYGEEITNSVQFYSLDYNVSTRTKTSQNVTWTIPDWNNSDETGPQQKTPDLTSLVQQIVNKSGWQSGNAMSFIITGSGSRVAHSYDGSSSMAPTLHVYYSAVTSIIEDSHDVKIYPNPSKGNFIVEAPQFTTYEILDGQGRIVQKGELNQASQNISTSQLSGFYFLRLADDQSGLTIVKQMIFKP